MTRSNTDHRQDELRAEIVQTRAALGDTVQALAAKADVKARVRASASQTADRIKGSVRQARRSPETWMVVTAAAAATAAVILLLRGFSDNGRSRRRGGFDRRARGWGG
jgi:anti-sigma-K factor RskA